MSFCAAISGRNAATKFSPAENMKAEAITNVMASATSPGPARASSPVNSTQPAVVTARKRFLPAE